VQPRWRQYDSPEDRLQPLAYVALDRLDVRRPHGIDRGVEQIGRTPGVPIPAIEPLLRAKHAIQSLSLVPAYVDRFVRSLTIQSRKRKKVEAIKGSGFADLFHRLPVNLHSIRIEEDNTAKATQVLNRPTPLHPATQPSNCLGGVARNEHDLSVRVFLTQYLKRC